MSSPIPLEPVRAVLDRARTQCPAPLSVLSSELLFELSAREPDWGRVFLLQVDLFEAAVAFFSFVQLAEMQRLEVAPSASLEAITPLRDGGKMSTGSWWRLLRDTSTDLRAKDRALLELPAIAAGLHGPENGFTKQFEAVPNLRNRVKGHAWTLPPEEYAVHAQALLETTRAFLVALERLEGCFTAVVAQCTAHGPGGFLLDLRLLDGDSRRPARRTVQSASALSPGRVLVGRRRDLDQPLPSPPPLLDLHPFVQLRPDGLYLAQALTPKHLELACIAGGARHACAESLAEATARLTGITARSAKERRPYESLRARARELATALLASPAATASYDPRTYLARPRLVQQLDAVASGSATEGAGRTRLWLASAPSGSGKTALACHFAERWLSGGRQEDVAVVALASELLAAGGTLESWWHQRFGKSPAESCRDAAGNNLLLFVDGLDRLADPDVVLDDLARLLRGPANDALRVIASSTEAVADRAWARLREKGAGEWVHRWSMPPLSPSEARRLFELLGAGSEDGPRLGKEVEPLLSTPLLVRLARSLGEQETAVGLTPGRLLRAHADRTVLADPVRAHVALRLVERILADRSKSILLSGLIEDPTLRSSLLATGEDAPLRALVRDHVLLLDRAPAPGGLPTPSEARLSFAFDAQLDYLCFASMTQRFGTSPRQWQERLCGAESPTRVKAGAEGFGPLVGGLRVFAVESLMSGGPAVAEELSALLAALPRETSRAVLAELFSSGLPTRPGAPLEQLATAYCTALGAEGAEALAEAASGAFGRLVMAGRVEDALAAAELVARVAPGVETVNLRAHATRFAAWTAGPVQGSKVLRAVVLGRSLLADAKRTGNADAVMRALDALREVLLASGDAEEARESRALEEELLRADAAGHAQSDEAKVAVALCRARGANNHEKREHAFDEATRLAAKRNVLAMRVALARAEAYADKRMDLTSEERQEMTQAAVDRACALGDPFLEAVACDFAAWSWHMDLSVQSAWLERGLLAASATRADAARAKLLDRRGRAWLAKGKAQEAWQDGQQAAELFTRVGHRCSALRTQLHVSSVAATELGRPGEAHALWPRMGAEARALGATFEEALSTLLDGMSLCDLGRAAEAKARHALLGPLAGHLSGKQFVNGDLLGGRIALLEGKEGDALAAWRRAQAWGEENRFPDFVFQPPLLAARLRFSGGDPAGWDEALAELRTLLELKEKKSADNQPRYAGEIYLLLARGLLQKGALQEAETWITAAVAWMGAHPNHPAHPEVHAVRSLLLAAQRDRVEGQPEEKGERRKGKSEADRKRVELDGKSNGAAAEARKWLAALAASYAEEADRAAYVATHEATRLLARR
ncbi:MAG: hypothetical protein RL653_4471 [Pseudomonadota bacterium]|jgi:hypothetical protein